MIINAHIDACISWHATHNCDIIKPNSLYYVSAPIAMEAV